MSKIGIIIGSIREPRRGLKVGEWVLSQTKDQSVQYEIIDLRDFNLPHYNEPGSPRTSNGYVHETTIRWSNKVKEYDGFIFVTPEYNGYFTGVLKDAIDFLYHEWAKKPFAIVGYGGRGAKWAAGHLATVLKRFEMTEFGFVGIHKPWASIDEQGNINSDSIEGNLSEIMTSFEQYVKENSQEAVF